MKHLPFNATISALDAETSARWYQCSHGVSSDIGDCGVGITTQMCNRVTNHGDMGTFSKPGLSEVEDGGTARRNKINRPKDGEVEKRDTEKK